MSSASMIKRNILKRSGADWAVRVLTVLVVGFIGYTAISASLADVLSRYDPVLAHMVAPTNGRITASLSEVMFKAKPTGSIDSKSAESARLALRQDATAVSAVVTLASQAQLRGDQPEAQRLFGYAQTLSRRNLPSQLWAINDALSRGDVIRALRHYDIALRVSRGASTILYPILVAALADPQIRSGLTLTMAKKPAWGPEFVAYALKSSTNPRLIARLFVDMRSAGVAVAPEASSSLINRLLLLNVPDDAWRYYASLRKPIDRSRLRDGSFTVDPVSPSQFDWLLGDGNGLTASIDKNANGGSVNFSVATGHGGVIIRQTQMLPPGVYQLSGTASGVSQPDSSLPYWTLTCSNGQELGRIVLAQSKKDISAFSGRFDVPRGCPVQNLAFVARPTDMFAGITGRLNGVDLRPVT